MSTIKVIGNTWTSDDLASTWPATRPQSYITTHRQSR